ncbi:integrase, catalytic region, zinc finger, CCHC-type containing protein [Tanacetum coccineum]
MQMESYESFMCRCEGGNVVLRQSHKPHSFGKLYYACPRSKPSQKNHGCGYFKWKDEITFGNASSFSGPTTPSNSSSRIKILEARLAMEKNPDDHPCESAAILHELLNEMENLRYESTPEFGSGSGGCGDDEIADDEDGGEDEEDEEDGDS